jgi:hypothetical protein
MFILAKSESKPESKSSLTETATVEQISSEIASAFVPILPANAVVESPKVQNESQQKQQLQSPTQQQQEKSPVAKSSEVSKDVEKKEEKTVTSVAAVTSNKSETAQAKAETQKTDSTVNVLDFEQENLDNSPNDKDVDPFSDTQSELPEKEIDTGLDIDPEDEDPDGDYSPDMNNQNSNKFNNLPLTDVESHDNDQSRVRVEKVLDEFEDNPDSNFFTYLCIVMFLSILFYILYHNRHKILALLLEGRRGSRRPRERSRGGSKAAYSKLDCNLEEAITSKKSLSGKSMDIIY